MKLTEDQKLREALHQWLGAYAAGYFANLPAQRRATVQAIKDTSKKALKR